MRATASLFALAAFLALSSATLLANAGPLPEPFHNQWQPETENDPRLQQPVQIEIIGRATRTGLPILSEKTGVSLGVLPQDLDTVGERKFTLIAQGCDLKTIMVQLCEALQECHWDVDDSGERPAYLLHRNAGVDMAVQKKANDLQAEGQARGRNERVTRVEEARAALAMTPEEVAELEKTDVFLARALRYPPMRDAMEAFFSFAPDQIQQFLDPGRLGIPYSQLPEKAQQALLRAAQEQVAASLSYMESHPQEQTYLADVEAYARALPERIEKATIHLIYSPYAIGLGISIRVPGGGGPVVIAIPPRYARPHSPWLSQLLVATGDTEETASQILSREYQRGEQASKAEEDRRKPDRTGLPPELRQAVSADIPDPMPLSELLRLVAEKTGFSVISDCYWAEYVSRPPDSDSLPDIMPVHQLLDTLAPWSVFEWETAGRCLVFHHRDWYERAHADVPESVVLAYRDKLRQQGHFTFDDALALAVEMNRLPHLAQRMRGPMRLPEDLEATGLGRFLHPRYEWASALAASLTSEQCAKAEGPQGLPFADMSRKQQEEVRRLLAAVRLPSEVPNPTAAAVFRIVRSEGVEDDRRYVQHEVRIDVAGETQPELTADVRLYELTPPRPSAPAPAPAG